MRPPPPPSTPLYSPCLHTEKLQTFACAAGDTSETMYAYKRFLIVMFEKKMDL